jgi:hypothetical protein
VAFISPLPGQPTTRRDCHFKFLGVSWDKGGC